MSVTHVAGPVVTFGKNDRIIQRCACCGESLLDVRPSRVAVQSEDGDRGVGHFAERHLVHVSGQNPKHYVDLGDFIEKDLPEDFCLALVESPS